MIDENKAASRSSRPFFAIGFVKAAIDKEANHFKKLLGVSAQVKLVEPEATERSQGKAVRVVDNRTI